jgi:putative acetyltransferase
MDPTIRTTDPDEYDAVAALVARAFGRDTESRLVLTIRQRREDVISLVAVEADRIVGHVLGSPITITPHADGVWLGLAPLAVEPDRQGCGVGGHLMRAAIEAARTRGASALFLLGNPLYYGRFGFRATHVDNDYGAKSSFMALELVDGCLAHVHGIAHYVSAFAETGA